MLFELNKLIVISNYILDYILIFFIKMLLFFKYSWTSISISTIFLNSRGHYYSGYHKLLETDEKFFLQGADSYGFFFFLPD